MVAVFALISLVLLLLFGGKEATAEETKVSVPVASFNGTNDPKNWLRPGKCKGLWRDEKLVGKCFGFYDYKRKYAALSTVEVTTSAECRSLCCNMGEKCVNWQFYSDPSDPSVHQCRITDKIVRLGFEKTGTPDWCDPHPPARWNGYAIKSRNADGTCVVGDFVPYQCFGLGDERKNDSGKPLEEKECAQACCNDPTCDVWQQLPNRGCYYSKHGGQCPKNTGVFDGGRKCVEGFCDGQEATKLGTKAKA